MLYFCGEFQSKGTMNMRAKILIICLLCACSITAQVSEGIAKNKVYQGFSGGMMLHTGYLFGQD